MEEPTIWRGIRTTISRGKQPRKNPWLQPGIEPGPTTLWFARRSIRRHAHHILQSFHSVPFQSPQRARTLSFVLLAGCSAAFCFGAVLPGVGPFRHAYYYISRRIVPYALRLRGFFYFFHRSVQRARFSIIKFIRFLIRYNESQLLVSLHYFYIIIAPSHISYKRTGSILSRFHEGAVSTFTVHWNGVSFIGHRTWVLQIYLRHVQQNWQNA